MPRWICLCAPVGLLECAGRCRVEVRSAVPRAGGRLRGGRPGGVCAGACSGCPRLGGGNPHAHTSARQPPSRGNPCARPRLRAARPSALCAAPQPGESRGVGPAPLSVGAGWGVRVSESGEAWRTSGFYPAPGASARLGVFSPVASAHLEPYPVAFPLLFVR